MRPVLRARGAARGDVPLARQSNASFAVLETAPFTAKLLTSDAEQSSATNGEDSRRDRTDCGPGRAAHGGSILQDKDVLLITVDALRADMLSAYGGHGLTPVLDQMSRESVVFRAPTRLHRTRPTHSRAC